MNRFMVAATNVMAVPAERVHTALTDRRIRLGEKALALVHHHGPDRAHDLALAMLALVVAGVIAIAVPLLRFCVDGIFGLFQ
jgi:hypothetical protein